MRVERLSAARSKSGEFAIAIAIVRSRPRCTPASRLPKRGRRWFRIVRLPLAVGLVSAGLCWSLLIYTSAKLQPSNRPGSALTLGHGPLVSRRLAPKHHRSDIYGTVPLRVPWGSALSIVGARGTRLTLMLMMMGSLAGLPFPLEHPVVPGGLRARFGGEGHLPKSDHCPLTHARCHGGANRPTGQCLDGPL